MGNKKTALITGGSSGIGFELAKLFARDGYDLVIVSVDEKRLQSAKEELEKNSSVRVTAVSHDLSKQDSATSMVTLLESRGIHHIDALVNNAGFGLYGRFVDINEEEEVSMMNLNMITLTRLTKIYLPKMLENGKGKILNVASTAAFQPGPLMAVYYATKSYVLSFTEAIAEEVRDTSITVTALCPGPTASHFQERASMEDSRLIKNSKLPTAASVATVGYNALMNKKVVVVAGIKNKLFAQLTRLVPRRLATRFVMKLQGKKN